MNAPTQATTSKGVPSGAASFGAALANASSQPSISSAAVEQNSNTAPQKSSRPTGAATNHLSHENLPNGASNDKMLAGNSAQIKVDAKATHEKVADTVAPTARATSREAKPQDNATRVQPEMAAPAIPAAAQPIVDPAISLQSMTISSSRIGTDKADANEIANVSQPDTSAVRAEPSKVPLPDPAREKSQAIVSRIQAPEIPAETLPAVADNPTQPAADATAQTKPAERVTQEISGADAGSTDSSSQKNSVSAPSMAVPALPPGLTMPSAAEAISASAKGKTIRFTETAPSSTTHGSAPSKNIAPASDSGNSDAQVKDPSAARPAAPDANNASDAQGSSAKTVDPASASITFAAGHTSILTSGTTASNVTSDGPSGTHVTAGRPQPAANLESLPASGINASQLIQSMSTTAMHVGMRSAEFGEVSIRTSVSQQQMLTQISVEHSDLGKAITEHLPSVQAKLADNFGLRASIEVHHSDMAFSGEREQSSQQDRRPNSSRAFPGAQSTAPEFDRIAHSGPVIIDSGYRLDITA